MVKVATVSIALGMVVMILSIAIVTGFRTEIEGKIIGFGGHLEVTSYDSNISYESTPISKNQDFLPHLQALEGVRHVQTFAIKGGIIATPTDNQGVLLKGMGADFDWSFFNTSLVEGRIPAYSDTATSNEVLVSTRLARMLKLNLDDRFDVFFAQEPVRQRRFAIVGIFDTQLQEIDEKLVLCDIRHIQRLNGWESQQIGGFEINITDMNLLDKLYDKVSGMVEYRLSDDGTLLSVSAIESRFPHLFSWLDILDTNVWIILSLTLLVAGFNMVSGLLIMLLEKVSMIGLLKSLGMRSWQLQKLFIYRSAFMVFKGALVGNIIGIALCLLQKYFAIIPLDPDSYFVSAVPINLSVIHILLLNLGTLTLILAALAIPSLFITKITPEKSIRFE
jgi:lipoprotein-releasing system permease protein